MDLPNKRYLTPQEVANLKEELKRLYSGLNNAHPAKVIEEGEFIESRPVDWKRWMPRLIRDLICGGKQ